MHAMLVVENGILIMASDNPARRPYAWGDTFGMLTDKFGIHWMVNIAPPK